MQTNPATSVHAPKHIVTVGKTVVLSSEDTRALFESIDTSTLIGLRDRALIGVMAYSFARIGAMLAMRVENYLPIGKGWFLRLREKRRQATRSPRALCARALPRCVHRSRGPCRGTESTPVLFGAAAHGSLDTKPNAPEGCVQDDPPPRAKSRYRGQDRMSYLPGYGDHQLSRAWRRARGSAENCGAFGHIDHQIV